MKRPPTAAHRVGGRWGVALAATLLISLAWMLPGPHSARASEVGVPLPAEAGSQWRIVAGYNTGSHTGSDPHALDIVREDAPTAGSLVLAPVAGEISWLSSDCIVLRDGAGLAHLLCHVWTLDGVARGQTVAQGQPLATVAPAGFTGNGGLSHIHYAVHHTAGSGQLQNTVPFVGVYALEGRDLFDNGLFNEHMGQRFTSTNGAGGNSGADPGTDLDPSPDPIDDPAPDATDPANAESDDHLAPGWNLVGWTGDTAVEDATAPIRDQISAVFSFDAPSQSFRLYSPALPSSLNALQALEFGDGLWVFVTDPAGAQWPRPSVIVERNVVLHPGFNLVTWTAPLRGVETATANLSSVLVSLHAFDADQQSFQTYRPSGPAFLNGLAELASGQAVWIEVREAAVWAQR
ncbi:MAG: M23 family metallopeptidase [Dehalococcoidia bacterium]